jgi:uncharacterized protein (TIGR02266 family)
MALVLKVEYPSKQALADATENISYGGVFVQTTQKFPVGEEVLLSLSFPGLLDPLEIMGKVSWVRAEQTGGRGPGVGFAVETPEHRKRLERLLSVEPSVTAATAAAPASGYRVLIVEDNPHIIEMYSYVLKKLAAGDLKGKVPLEVHFAADGHAALAQLKSSAFNLVMTDIYMPVMDGFALVQAIRSEATLKHIPVVAISAGGKDAQEKALQLGVDMYLRKPVKFAEVLETVKQLLRIK